MRGYINMNVLLRLMLFVQKEMTCFGVKDKKVHVVILKVNELLEAMQEYINETIREEKK